MYDNRTIGLSTAALSALVLLGSCSHPAPIEVPGDAGGARTTMTQALEAWKQGGRPEALLEALPAIQIGDEDWEAGKRLKAYEITREPELNGSHWRVYANLTLDPPEKPGQSKQVCYAVSLKSPVVIIRSDFLN